MTRDMSGPICMFRAPRTKLVPPEGHPLLFASPAEPLTLRHPSSPATYTLQTVRKIKKGRMGTHTHRNTPRPNYPSVCVARRSKSRRFTSPRIFSCTQMHIFCQPPLLEAWQQGQYITDMTYFLPPCTMVAAKRRRVSQQDVLKIAPAPVARYTTIQLYNKKSPDRND